MKIQKLTKEERYNLTGRELDQAAAFMEEMKEDTTTPEEALERIAALAVGERRVDILAAYPFTLCRSHIAEVNSPTGNPWTVSVAGVVRWYAGNRYHIAEIDGTLWDYWNATTDYRPDAWIRRYDER